MSSKFVKQKVVVIGGGTGTHTILSGLKKYADQLDIAAVVTMADSGGSTGRLRDEFGYLPVGDTRMALTALASDHSDQALLRQLFTHRFSTNGDLAGHNVGNLLLVALTDLLGSEEVAIAAAAHVLRVKGVVIPVTTKKTDLIATYDNGQTRIGEHAIDEPIDITSDQTITDLFVTPDVTINPNAAAAITEADLVVLGPGDLFTSILANCVVPGMSAALQRSQAKIVYVANLMTKRGQTNGMGVAAHVRMVSKLAGVTPDSVLINTESLDADLLAHYATEEEFPVVDDYAVAGAKRMPLLATEKIVTTKGDAVKRSLIRHHPDLLARAVCDCFDLSGNMR